jgi:hypothetical protein
MTDTTHNGWTNYATWRVNLEMIDGMNPADLNCDNATDLAQELSHYCRSCIELTSDGLARDYALAFLSDVNWGEIARHLIEAHANA